MATDGESHETDEAILHIKLVWDAAARVYVARFPGCEVRLSPAHYTAAEMSRVIFALGAELGTIHAAKTDEPPLTKAPDHD
jgi:hypothetical protein